MMSCATLIWYFCGSAAVCVVEIPRSQIETYKPEHIRWAKSCAAKHGIRWRIVER